MVPLGEALHRGDAIAAVPIQTRRVDEIEMLAVDAPQRSVGVGTAVTAFALDWIRCAGISVAMVETGADPVTRLRAEPTRRPG
jgi:GNAT superfamily N-acetyltransferase